MTNASDDFKRYISMTSADLTAELDDHTETLRRNSHIANTYNKFADVLDKLARGGDEERIYAEYADAMRSHATTAMDNIRRLQLLCVLIECELEARKV